MGKSGGMVNIEYALYDLVTNSIKIESMLKYLDPNQSAARDKRLQLYITKSHEMIDESVAEIAAIRADFTQWKNLTTSLLRGLEEKAGNSLTLNQMPRSD
jgi:hypothetical protein